MKQSRFDDEQIIGFLKQADAGSSNNSLLGQLSSKIKDFISPATPPQQKVLTDDERPKEPTPSEASKVDIALALNTAALHASSFRIALQHTLKLNMPSHYAAVIIDLTKITKDSATRWALLFEWMVGDIEQCGLLDRHAHHLIRGQLKLATQEMCIYDKETIEMNLIVID